MSTAEQNSSLQILPPDKFSPTSGGPPARSDQKVWQEDRAFACAAADAKAAGLWLNGDVLACACPECHGPMSIRLWLLVADCWMCGASIELSEEQERAAMKLLAAAEKAAAREAPRQETTPPAAIAVKEKAHRPKGVPPVPPSKVAPAPPRPPIPQTKPRPAVKSPPIAAPPPPPRPIPPLGPAAKAAMVRRSAHDWLRDLPAWLVSLIFHIVAMLLLGLLTIAQNDNKQREIILAATMGKAGQEGGEKKLHEHEDAIVIKDPGPEEAPEPEPTPEIPLPDLPPLRVEVPQPLPRLETTPSAEERDALDLPSLADVRDALAETTAARMFEGRDPRVRTQMVLAEGGTMYTEAAVAQGLYWLHRHQASEGHWSLDHFPHHGNCNGRCSGHGDGHSDVGATALALLPFLGAGQTHTRGTYKDTVERGLRWLVSQQKPNGDLRGEGRGQMYAHGIASIALCEAYALTGDTAFKKPAQTALNFIVKAQHKSSGRGAGGWRYEPGQPGDTSVVGWQLMALRSGKIGRLQVPVATFTQAGKFLDSVQHGHYGGLYSYQRGRAPEPAMIAEGLLCRQYLGWPQDHRGLHEGVNYLLAEHLPSKDEPNIYYWYYGTQVMHHMGGAAWERWNNAMREALVELQEREGHEAGSWSPVGGAIGGHDVRVGGRIYVTALSICTLEVYYRHLPIYRAIEIEGEE